ncbi:hypothetical protein YC2023_001748 [Brassica napus]
MNSTRAPGTQAASPPMPPGATRPVVYHAASPPMPPGATGPAVYHAGSPPMPPGATGAAPNHAASSSRSNSYPQMTLNAMLNSPARLSQPHLHPDKPNGALCKRGYVYGLGSEQFREHAPSSRVPNGIARNLDLEMRVGGLETTLQSVTSDVAGVKQDVSDMRQDFAATRKAINQLLQTLRPPQAPTGQTSDHQAQAPTVPRRISGSIVAIIATSNSHKMGIHIKGEMARENIETVVVVKTDKGKIQRERETLVCFHNKKIPLYVMEKICRTLDDVVSWFGAVVTLRGVKPILKLIFQKVIYFLWRERNIRHHSSVLKPASLVLFKILLLRV